MTIFFPPIGQGRGGRELHQGLIAEAGEQHRGRIFRLGQEQGEGGLRRLHRIGSSIRHSLQQKVEPQAAGHDDGQN
jgi:hypothetical protein